MTHDRHWLCQIYTFAVEERMRRDSQYVRMQSRHYAWPVETEKHSHIEVPIRDQSNHRKGHLPSCIPQFHILWLSIMMDGNRFGCRTHMSESSSSSSLIDTWGTRVIVPTTTATSGNHSSTDVDSSTLYSCRNLEINPWKYR